MSEVPAFDDEQRPPPAPTIDEIRRLARSLPVNAKEAGYVAHQGERGGELPEPVEPDPALPIAVVRTGDLSYPDIPSMTGPSFRPLGVYRRVEWLEGPFIPEDEGAVPLDEEVTGLYPARYGKDLGNGKGDFVLSLRQPLDGMDQPWVPVHDPRGYEWPESDEGLLAED